MIPENTLGEKITAFLENADMKPADLARESGLSRGYVSSLINGAKTNPSDETLQRIAVVFNVSPEELKPESVITDPKPGTIVSSPEKDYLLSPREQKSEKAPPINYRKTLYSVLSMQKTSEILALIDDMLEETGNSEKDRENRDYARFLINYLSNHRK